MNSRRLADDIVVFFCAMGSRISNWKRRNTLKRFITEVKTTFPNGTVISNPGGGTSTIAGLSDSTISYVRKQRGGNKGDATLYQVCYWGR